jgi:integrase
MTREPKAATLERHFRTVAGGERNEFEGHARAPNTWKQYASTIARFQEWCGERKLRSMPAEPATVKAWIVDLARGNYTSATIRAYVSGVATWHRLQGQDFDRRPLAETLRGIGRNAAPRKKARPLLREELADILASLDTSRPADARDGALLAIGWAAALRRVELVGLDWRRRGAGSNATGILHLTEHGLRVELLRSKTMQDEAVAIDIPNLHMPAAIAWCALWVSLGNIRAGTPLFRPFMAPGAAVGSARLTDHSAAEIVRKRAIALEVSRGVAVEDATLRADEFSGHSLRAGYCTSAALAGVPEYLIRQRSRHKSPEIVADYVRAAETINQHGLGKVGL